ncbi:MAG TPA: T9SS type A sorting domain-containing protein [Fluviicola sp.]|nr:T9SS type A sorting domain-containing protein [Fluviicola sp.]
MNRLIVLITCCLFGNVLSAQTQTFNLQENWWETNSPVDVIYHDTLSNRVYLSGSFSYIGHAESYGVPVVANTGIPLLDRANPNGYVRSVVEDGNGGWYIGGEFTRVGDSTRLHIAHIDQNGQVLPDLASGFNNSVSSLVVNDNKLYVGGEFTSHGSPDQYKTYGAVVNDTDGNALATSANPNDAVLISVPDGNGGWYLGGEFTQMGGFTRNHIAHINSLGQVTSWNPNVNGDVNTIVVSGSTIYIGGIFTTIGGQTRNRIAAVNAATGLPTSWNPASTGEVNSLAMGSGVIYAGGNFNTIGGQTRSRIAAIDLVTGLATTWNPTASAEVNAVAFDGTVVYIGGSFTSAGGQTRNRIAAIDVTTGLATAWNPNASGTVNSIIISGPTIYVGGGFSTIGGQSRSCIAAIDVTTGLATTWNPNAGSSVYGMAISGNTIYLAGFFTSIAGSSRNRAAAIDVTTGLALPWNPNVLGNYIEYTVSVSNSGVYIGGNNPNRGGLTRNYLASIDLVSDQLTSWNPGANFVVNDFEISGQELYVGGAFTSIAGQSRNRLASFDLTSGLLSSWNPNANQTVNEIKVAGSVVYVGGNFTTIGGQSRNRLAALSPVTGLATSWNPDANSTVFAIEVTGTAVYAGGFFTSIGGQSRSRIAALDVVSGTPTSWNPIVNGNRVQLIKSVGQKIYVGGTFDNFLGEERGSFAVFDETTGLLDPWQMNTSGGVYCMAFSGPELYVGGAFTLIGGHKRESMAAVDLATGEITDWNPGLILGYAEAIIRLGNILYVGGTFSQVNGQPRTNLAAFDLSTGVLLPWAPVIGQVHALGATHTDLFVGGSFLTVNGVAREGAAAFDGITGQLLPWNANLDGSVYDIEFYSPHVYLAGSFTVDETFVVRARLASFDTLVGTYTSWDVNPDQVGLCNAMDIVGNTLFVGGAFSHFNNQARTRLAAFDLTTGLLKPWNPSANGYVTDLKATDSAVFVATSAQTFTQVGGQPRRYFAAIDAVTGQTLSWDPFQNAPAYVPNPDYNPETIETAGNMVFIGGVIDTISDVKRANVAVYNTCFSTSSTTNQFACGSYTWNGNTYTTSGLHSVHFTNAAGCDSTAYLNLTLGNNASVSTVSSCNSYTWPANGQVYTSSGTYSATLQNMVGCDSVVTLNLSIHNASFGTFSHTACESYTWPLNNQTYTASGSYPALTQNMYGCDSTVMLNLTILNESATTIPVSVCGSYTWPQNNQTYTTSGQHAVTLTNMLGCDSTVTLDLTILPATGSSVNALECISYTWPQNNQTYTSSGQYTDTLANAFGCDSIITLNLTILNGSTTVETISACNSYTWSANGTTYMASGQYNETLTSVLGCDSLVTLDLTITPPPTATATDDGLGTLTGTAGNQVQWIDCNSNTAIAGATSTTFSPTVNGTYAIVVNYGPNCSDTSNCLMVNYIGLNESKMSDVLIFPNPATDEVYITFPGESVEVTVNDAQGKFIFRQVVVPGESVSLAQLETGVYLFVFITEQGKTVKRVVKQ